MPTPGAADGVTTAATNVPAGLELDLHPVDRRAWTSAINRGWKAPATIAVSAEAGLLEADRGGARVRALIQVNHAGHGTPSRRCPVGDLRR